ALHEALDDEAKLVQVVTRLPRHKLFEGRHGHLGKEISLGQCEHPDPRELDQRSALLEEIILHRKQAVAQVAKQFSKIALFLTGVLPELLAVDEEQSDIRHEELPEQLNAPLRLGVAVDVLLEPFAWVVVPEQFDRIEVLRFPSSATL